MSELEKHLALWRQAMIDDENAVERTLTSLAWHHAVFLTVVKAVDLVPESDNGSKPLNPYVLELLSTSYWGGVVMAIRRLVDSGPLRGPKGVSSLRSVIRDIREKRTHVTRRAYIETIAGLQYDGDEVERRSWAYLLSLEPGQGHWIPPEFHYEFIHARHAQFDFLSGVSKADRSPDDLIREEIFDRLDARLDKVRDIAEQGTIYFAHASTKESRASRGIDKIGPKESQEAFQILVETSTLVCRWFLYYSLSSALPTPQDNQFRHLDRPLLQTDDDTLLVAQWDEYSDAVERWSQVDDSTI